MALVTDEDHHINQNTSLSTLSDYNYNMTWASFRTVDEASITGLSIVTSRSSASGRSGCWLNRALCDTNLKFGTMIE